MRKEGGMRERRSHVAIATASSVAALSTGTWIREGYQASNVGSPRRPVCKFPKILVSMAWLITSCLLWTRFGGTRLDRWKTYTRPLRVQFRLWIVCWEFLGGAEEGFGNFHWGCAGYCCLRQAGGAADADYIDEEDGVALVEEVGCPALAVVGCLEPCLYCHLDRGLEWDECKSFL